MHIRREPLHLAQPYDAVHLFQHARVDGQHELMVEALTLAKAAAVEIEHYGQLALILQTITVSLPCWPSSDRFPLPVAPVPYTTDATITVDGVAFTDFFLKAGLRPEIWLNVKPPKGRVEITYTAGFGEGASQVPDDLRLAIMDQAAVYLDQRGALGSDGTPTGISPHAARIVARYRRVGL